MEQWALIEDFPSYEVSNLGRVRNERTGRLLGVYDNGHGIMQVVMQRDGRGHARAVHKLVATAFLHPPPDDAVPIFLDGNSRNLAADNLEWKPRWFAIKRTRQARRTHARDNRPILMVRTGQEYANALECAIDIDGLEELVLITAQNPYSTYKGSEFKFLQN